MGIQVNCNRIRLQNCHAGSYSAKYHLDLNNYNVKGNSTLRIHYFEGNGNVQLYNNMIFKPVDIVVQQQQQQQKEDTIIKQIRKWENEIFSKLQIMYEDTMNDNILKCIRRVLPISKTKFEWNANLHRMIENLKDK